MNSEELEKLIFAILNRGNPRYTTPSGAFLELLREYATNGNIEGISEMSSLYCKKYPEVKNFITAQLPGIVVNNFFTVCDALNFEKFIQFAINTRNWADGIEEKAFIPKDFVFEIESIIERSNNFQKPPIVTS